jgi:hypothetical protein
MWRDSAAWGNTRTSVSTWIAPLAVLRFAAQRFAVLRFASCSGSVLWWSEFCRARSICVSCTCCRIWVWTVPCSCSRRALSGAARSPSTCSCSPGHAAKQQTQLSITDAQHFVHSRDGASFMHIQMDWDTAYPLSTFCTTWQRLRTLNETRHKMILVDQTGSRCAD